MAFIYILRCDDDSLYTGITNNIEKRIQNHLGGKGSSHAKYMRGHKPVELAALWKTEQYNVAAKLEYAIKKKLTRRQKLELIQTPENVADFFPHLSEYDFCVIKDFSISFDN